MLVLKGCGQIFPDKFLSFLWPDSMFRPSVDRIVLASSSFSYLSHQSSLRPGELQSWAPGSAGRWITDMWLLRGLSCLGITSRANSSEPPVCDWTWATVVPFQNLVERQKWKPQTMWRSRRLSLAMPATWRNNKLVHFWSTAVNYLYSSQKWTKMSCYTFSFSGFWFFFFFFEIGSHCSPGWPSGHYVAQPAFQLTAEPTHDSLRFILFCFLLMVCVCVCVCM